MKRSVAANFSITVAAFACLGVFAIPAFCADDAVKLAQADTSKSGPTKETEAPPQSSAATPAKPTDSKQANSSSPATPPASASTPAPAPGPAPTPAPAAGPAPVPAAATAGPEPTPVAGPIPQEIIKKARGGDKLDVTGDVALKTVKVSADIPPDPVADAVFRSFNYLTGIAMVTSLLFGGVWLVKRRKEEAAAAATATVNIASAAPTIPTTQPEPKAESKSETKSELKADSEPETMAESKPEKKAKSESKVDPPAATEVKSDGGSISPGAEASAEPAVSETESSKTEPSNADDQDVSKSPETGIENGAESGSPDKDGGNAPSKSSLKGGGKKRGRPPKNRGKK